MSTNLYYILSVMLILCSCNEKEIITNGGIDLQIAINGSLSDSNEIQTIYLENNTRISNSANANPISNANIQITHDGITHGFTESEQGKYESEVPFAIGSDKTFEVKYEVDTASLIEIFKAPSKIIINNLITVEDGIILSLMAEIESSVDQYFLHEIYTQEPVYDSVGIADTIWEKRTGSTLLELTYAKTGTSIVELTNENNQFTLPDKGKLIKVKLTPITKNVYQYFMKLNNYLGTIATYNLYVNAPRFYSNQFYGITYATLWIELNYSL